MSTRRSWFSTSLTLLIALMVLAACGPQATAPIPTPVTIQQTVIVPGTPETITIEKTVIVQGTPQTVVVTATPAPVPPAAGVEQVFRVALGRDTGVLNPHNYASAFPALAMVYEPLVRYAADGTIQPCLAESWEISDDGLTWTFHLRKGVTFQDGTPFDAQAVKWNLQQWVGVERHSWLPTGTNVKSMETPDDYTVVLTMKEFYYPAMQDLALVRPVRFLSPKSVDANGNFVKAIGTGPWQVEEYVPEQHTTFVPYANYWGTKPTLSKVVFEVIPDAETRIAALLSGEADLIGGEYIGGISLESLPVLKRNPKIQVLTGPGTTTYLVQMNFTRAPFDDAKVRQAVNYAIDRNAISQKIFQGLAEPAKGIFPPDLPYISYPHPELYAFDPAKAKALLAEAGWTAGSDGILAKGGKPFQVKMVIDSTMFPQAKSIGEVVQSQLADIGIKMDLSLMEYGGWSDALSKWDYDLATNITQGSPYDPHSTLYQLFHTMGTTGLEGKVYEDAQLNKLIEDMMKIKDVAARKDAYAAILSYIDTNAVSAPIVYSSRVYALRGGVQNFHLGGTEYELDLGGVTITGN